MSTPTERTLIRQAQEGSRAAAAELFRLHWRRVWRAVYAIAGRRDLADDIAQETFIRAFAALSSFDPDRPLAPWLNRIAANRAIDELRRERWLTDDPLPEGTDVLREIDNEVIAAIRKLTPPRRIVIALRFWLDWPIDDIAAALDVPRGTVMSRLGRALDDLRADLEATNVK